MPIRNDARSVIRALLLLAGLLAFVPFLAWLLRPRSVLTHPQTDPTGVLDLVYLVLGSAGTGLPASPTPILWFYAILTVSGLEALVLALLLITRGWKHPGVPLLAAFLVAGAAYFGVYFISMPHGTPAWLATWLLGGGSAFEMTLMPLALGLGLASLVPFAAHFPRSLTATDVEAFHGADASWRSDARRRFGTQLGDGWRHVMRRARLPVRTRERDMHSALSAFDWLIRRRGIWLAFPFGAYMLHLTQRFTDVGAVAAIMVFPVLGLGALYGAHVLFAVQREVATPVQAKQVAWIAGGLRAALFLWVVFGIASYALTWVVDDAGWQLYMAMLFAFGPLLIATCVVSALGAAVLLGGAIDPDLAVRRTTVYATLGVCFGSVFAVLEEWFAGIMVERVGVSDGVATVLLGASVAIALTPAKSIVDRLVARWVIEQASTRRDLADSVDRPHMSQFVE